MMTVGCCWLLYLQYKIRVTPRVPTLLRCCCGGDCGTLFKIMDCVAEPPTDRLTYALSVLAGDPCIQIGQDVFQACKDIRFEDDDGRAVCGSSPSTWLCEGALFFTLIKADSKTLVYSHTNGVLYYGTPLAQLSAACPPHTAVMCQFAIDSLPEGDVPRLLAFDVVAGQAASDPAQRGETLRSLAVHLPTPLCCVQWVGPRQYLTGQFVAGLPHKTKGGVVLTPNSHFVVHLPSI